MQRLLAICLSKDSLLSIGTPTSFSAIVSSIGFNIHFHAITATGITNRANLGQVKFWLRRLKLPYRRSRGDMIEVYKIMSGKYDSEISNIFQHQEQENHNTRGHKYKLFKPRCRLNIRKNSLNCPVRW
jgi:hypothetical protein